VAWWILMNTRNHKKYVSSEQINEETFVINIHLTLKLSLSNNACFWFLFAIGIISLEPSWRKKWKGKLTKAIVTVMHNFTTNSPESNWKLWYLETCIKSFLNSIFSRLKQELFPKDLFIEKQFDHFNTGLRVACLMLWRQNEGGEQNGSGRICKCWAKIPVKT